MSKKKKKTTTNQKLKEDLKKVREDWENLAAHEELAHDPEFLGTLANDIMTLESDSSYNEEDGELIHHFISTPWGAPFASNLTLFDAALSLKHQEPENSDLSHLMEDFHRYGHQFEDQFLKIFEENLEE
ncbi:MAG: hypothetical protein SNF33_07825 [Candidatus Algichlamydia australiensis]|nr:hypothetical protein [Chlamydiales bacterium]